MRREVIFSLCLSVHTWGEGTPPRSMSRGAPWPGPDGGGGGYSHPALDGGILPSLDRGYPHPALDGGTLGRPWVQGTLTRDGVSPWPGPDGIPPWPGMGFPPSGPGMGYPPPIWTWTWDGNSPPPVRKTEGVVATRRSVCLLRSRRRTFLFKKKKFCLV